MEDKFFPVISIELSVIFLYRRKMLHISSHIYFGRFCIIFPSYHIFPVQHTTDILYLACHFLLIS